ncbi:MAG: BrnT family toxin [Syntrophobacterales bacterium]|nr:BrnT family toxin [Syntrophobacterales bacterium]
MMVPHTDRGDRTRIISTRELTRKEREAYEN